MTKCAECARRKVQGGDGQRNHCRQCHRDWGGREAQHALCCHQTFNSITAADAHRASSGSRKGPPREHCDDASVDPRFVEARPGVWALASSKPYTGKVS